MLAAQPQGAAPDAAARDSNAASTRISSGYRLDSIIAREIANEAHVLRASQNASEESGSPAGNWTEVAETCSALLLSNDWELFPEFSLGSFSVSAQVVIELLHHFERQYYPHASFLQPIKSFNNLASECPLLFWTIILIASERHERHAEVYQQLFEPHRELLVPFSNTAIASIEEIHAALLLCLWPVPKQKILYDPVYSYSSIAVDACLRLSLHKPFPLSDTTSCQGNFPYCSGAHSVATQQRTFLACFSVSTRNAAFLGLVPPLASPHQLKHVEKATERLRHVLSPRDHAILVICEIICSFSLLLEDFEDMPEQSSLIQTFIDNLDTVKRNYSARWTPELDAQLEYAKLNLYAIAGFLSPQGDFQIFGQDDVERQALLLRGLRSASNLVDRMKTISVRATADGRYDASSLIFYPKYFFTNLFFAVTALFRISTINKECIRAHRPHALQSINDALTIFQLLPNDRDMARVARLTRRILNVMHLETPWSASLCLGKLVIANRLGASLLWDTIFRLQRKAANGPGSEISEVGRRLIGTEGDGLPLAPEMKTRLPNTQSGIPTVSSAEDQMTAGIFSWDPYQDELVFDDDDDDVIFGGL
ncbi:MAG: hypothetical protein M1821_007649 [Bathelium mastoideum]|nr:MAG: hypothetical protein M1821_007649 [Bathelium mastoideum]